MIKVFCDRCGTEVNEKTGRYKLEIRDMNRTSDLFQCLIHERDLCEDCKTHIENQCRYDELEKE